MNNDYVVIEFGGDEQPYHDVHIRVTREGCLQITRSGELHVTYSPVGWLKAWRVEPKTLGA
jgi:hypothetical protein